MSDTNAMKFHGGLNLKRKASEWLQAADSTKLIAENLAAKDTIAQLGEMVKTLQEQMEALTPEPEPDVPHGTTEPVQTAPRRSRRKTTKG